MAGTATAAFTSGGALGTWINSLTETSEVNTTLGSGTRDLIGLATREYTADGVTSTSGGATYTDGVGCRSGIIAVFKVAAADAVLPSLVMAPRT
jgi:hypothetical protein